MTSIDDYCFFVDEALDGMVRIVDELATTADPTPQPDSRYW